MPAQTDKNEQTIDIDSLKKGDKTAFVRFIKVYQDMVFACCRTAGLGPEDCEDAAGETFLAVYRSIGSFDGKSKLSSWLWTIAWRKALHIRNKSGPKAVLSDDVLKTTAASEDAATGNLLENREQSELIWEAVQQLPENWASVIVLFYREDKKIGEIAEILKIPANTVKTYLDRGRKKLYDSLAAYWKDTYVKL